MVTNGKRTGMATGFPKGLALGTLAALGSTLALSAGLAALIGGGAIQEGNLGYGVMALLFLSAALGAGFCIERGVLSRHSDGNNSAVFRRPVRRIFPYGNAYNRGQRHFIFPLSQVQKGEGAPQKNRTDSLKCTKTLDR